MAKLGLVENGLRRRKRKSRRSKNPVAATAKSRKMGLATAKNILAKNGLKAVSKTSSNPRRKKRRSRNGVSASVPRRSNGFFGNTKADVKNVSALLGGAGFVKIAGRFVVPWTAKLLAQLGAERYAEIATDLGLSLAIVPMLASKLGGKNAADMARLGGLLVVGIDAVEIVAPDALSSFNPFSTSPVVLGSGGQPLMTAGAAKQIAAQAASEAAGQTVAKLGYAFDAMDNGGFAGANSSMSLPRLGVY